MTRCRDGIVVYHISFIKPHGYYFFFFFATHVAVATIQGWHLFLWEASTHQQWLDKVHTSDKAMIVRHCQYFAQSLSPVVSHENELYNTNSPSTSLVTVESEIICTCACSMYTSQMVCSKC